jgi:hypothetical protein
MSLSVLYMHKASSYPDISRDNRHLQIGCHQAHAIGSSAERPTWKWMFALSEFDIRYQPVKAVKRQALADLIAERINTDIAALSLCTGVMYFNGSACGDGCGIGILLVSPRGATYSFSIRLLTAYTNNLAEYEAVRKGMELLLEAGAEAVEIFRDSKLVISQLMEEYRCESESLLPLWLQSQELIAQGT